ncbi:MAG TPA: DUF1579 family protein [Chthoniobacterales bacterium]|jgi:hypothetical protein
MRFELNFTKPRIISLLLVCTAIGSSAVAQEDQHVKIRAEMDKLAPLVGNWNATWKFHRQGEIIERVGTHSISFVLDNTYLQWMVERHPKENPERSQAMLTFTTFNPRTNKYDTTHFYNGSALRVTANGEYDAATHELRDQAFIPLEDGVRDENVRAIINLSDPNNIVYTHYSKFDDEAAERLDLEIFLTRIRP